ncbi:hypothetical protein T492DRAFT_845717 [Pavlovales sp. CCMP2436]|nr:hypothetical protein T492DRAFT_845717 [Pavlovales sp. CCMP2436]
MADMAAGSAAEEVISRLSVPLEGLSHCHAHDLAPMRLAAAASASKRYRAHSLCTQGAGLSPNALPQSLPPMPPALQVNVVLNWEHYDFARSATTLSFQSTSVAEVYWRIVIAVRDRETAHPGRPRALQKIGVPFQHVRKLNKSRASDKPVFIDAADSVEYEVGLRPVARPLPAFPATTPCASKGFRARPHCPTPTPASPTPVLQVTADRKRKLQDVSNALSQLGLCARLVQVNEANGAPIVDGRAALCTCRAKPLHAAGASIGAHAGASGAKARSGGGGGGAGTGAAGGGGGAAVAAESKPRHGRKGGGAAPSATAGVGGVQAGGGGGAPSAAGHPAPSAAGAAAPGAGVTQPLSKRARAAAAAAAAAAAVAASASTNPTASLPAAPKRSDNTIRFFFFTLL